MTKLVTDVFVRGLAQTFLLAIALTISSVCLCFIVLAINHRIYGFTVEDDWKYVFMQAISFPFDSAFGTFVTGLSAIIPTMLATVCFDVVIDGSNPPKAGPDLNRIGHAYILVLAVGILLSIVAIFLLSTGDWSGVFREEAKDAALNQMRALFGAFLAIQGSYLSLLVKDKD